MPKSIDKIPHERAEEKRAKKGNSRKKTAMLNRITLLQEEIGCEGGEGNEASIEP